MVGGSSVKQFTCVDSMLNVRALRLLLLKLKLMVRREVQLSAELRMVEMRLSILSLRLSLWVVSLVLSPPLQLTVLPDSPDILFPLIALRECPPHLPDGSQANMDAVLNVTYAAVMLMNHAGGMHRMPAMHRVHHIRRRRLLLHVERKRRVASVR